MRKMHKKAGGFIPAAIAATIVTMGVAFLEPVVNGEMFWREIAAEEMEVTGAGAMEIAEETEDMGTEIIGISEEEQDTSAETVVTKPEVIISLTVPDGWQSKEAWVDIHAERIDGAGMFSIIKAEARISENGKWKDITEEMGLSITRNCSVYVRLTDEEGNVYEQNKYMECFDQTRPTLSAAAKDGVLTIKGIDEESGVAAIFVNDHEFTQLQDDTLLVRLQRADTAYQYFYLQVRDTAGNMSDRYKVLNPYYSNPDAVSDTTDNSGTEDNTISLPTDVTPTRPTSATATVIDHVTEEENVQEVMIGGDYSELYDSGRVQEMTTISQSNDKEFYTIQTDSEKVFYLIIDHSRTDNNVYLLTEVSENDLLNFTDTSTVTLPQDQAVVETVLPVITEAPEVTEEPKVTEVPVTEIPEEPEKAEESKGLYTLMGAVVLFAGAIAYYLKTVKRKKEAFHDYEDEEDEEDIIYEKDDAEEEN